MVGSEAMFSMKWLSWCQSKSQQSSWLVPFHLNGVEVIIQKCSALWFLFCKHVKTIFCYIEGIWKCKQSHKIKHVPVFLWFVHLPLRPCCGCWPQPPIPFNAACTALVRSRSCCARAQRSPVCCAAAVWQSAELLSPLHLQLAVSRVEATGGATAPAPPRTVKVHLLLL